MGAREIPARVLTRRPARVAVLAGREPAHRYSLHRAYLDAIWEVGATPVVFVPPPRGRLSQYLEAVVDCDAVCVCGGGDVDPRKYGLLPEDGVGLLDVDSLRDTAEVAAVHAAATAGRAVLGICRGAQVVAVAYGGRLHQDLVLAGHPEHWQEARQYEPVHAVDAIRSSMAWRALGGAGHVNSIHHQAVLDPGPHLVVTALSDDGVTEAVEADGVLGVQWHPERLAGSDRRHLAPFRWLMAA